MTYLETVAFLYARLPYFTRDGKSAIKNDLHNTLKLCEILGNPQNKFKCIHVAGTNGKGSVSNMLSAIFQAHGYKTGLYTSPHLKDFRERIRINGEMISEQFVVNFTEKIIPYLDSIQPSFFEITVAMCFDYFANQDIEYAIIETGLGGRLDSTNVINPILSVITNIGMDHSDLLGDTLQKIAFEKAGIIKEQIPVVIGESSKDTDSVFEEKAKSCNATIYFAERNVRFYNTEIETDLKGIYQEKNSVTVMQAIEVLKTMDIPFNDYTVAKAFQNVRGLTHFRGRWEILNQKPLTIADTGHNAHGLNLVIQQLKREKYNKLHIVFGMVKDKDLKPVIELLPKDATYYFCQANLPRALESETLKQECKLLGLYGEAYSSVIAAYQAAQKNSSQHDLIFIGGSTFVVAEVL